MRENVQDVKRLIIRIKELVHLVQSIANSALLMAAQRAKTHILSRKEHV
jgi:hypothetical protein